VAGERAGASQALFLALISLQAVGCSDTLGPGRIWT